MNKIDVEQYKKFIKLNFPTSSIIENPMIEFIYLRVNENNVWMELFSKYNEKCNESIFLNRFRCQFNRILLHLPLNDENAVNYCIRSAIESFLKFLYSIYFNSDFKSIDRVSFRNMKQELLSVNNDIYVNPDELNKLLNMYGTYSNFIHKKNQMNQVEFEYLQNVISRGEYHLVDLDKNLINIIDIYLLFITNIFNIKYKDFSAAERLRLRSNFTSNRLKKLIKRSIVE